MITLQDFIKAMDMTPENAFSYFESKGLELSASAFQTLNNFNHDKSFTVAGVADLNILDRIKNLLERAIIGDLTKQEFVDLLANDILPAYRMSVIWHTNIRGAYVKGRNEQMKTVKEQRPYLQRFAVLDNKTTGQSRFMNGMVFRIDDKVYMKNLHIMCQYGDRDHFTSMNERQFKRSGKKLSIGKNLVNRKIPVIHRTKKGKIKRSTEPLKNPKPFIHNNKPWVPDLSGVSSKLKSSYNKYIKSK